LNGSIYTSQLSSGRHVCGKRIQPKRSLMTWLITLLLIICPSSYEARADNLIVCPADVHQLMVIKEEVPPEQQQWSPLVEQEIPEPPHIKEEQEEPWTNQDGQQLQGLEEADIKFTLTPVAVMSEEYEEKLKSSKLHPSETKEDCGGPEPARNSGPDGHLQPGPEDKTEDSSETEEKAVPEGLRSEGP
ncbi:unnamed protein product, partial [Pleuronectes platessa]